MESESWTRTSWVVSDPDLTRDEIAEVLGLPYDPDPPLRRPRRHYDENKPWAIDMPVADTEQLDVHVEAAVAFLEAHADAFAALPSTTEVRLHISWTPKPGQNSLTFLPETIQTLARHKVMWWLSVYGAEEGLNDE